MSITTVKGSGSTNIGTVVKTVKNESNDLIVTYTNGDTENIGTLCDCSGHFKIFWDSRQSQDAQGVLPKFFKICKWKLDRVLLPYEGFFTVYQNLPQFDLQVTASSLSDYSPIGIASAKYELKFISILPHEYNLQGNTAGVPSFADLLNSEIPQSEKIRWVVGARADNIGIDLFLFYSQADDELWLVAETVQNRTEPLPFGVLDPETPIYEFEFSFSNMKPVEDIVPVEEMIWFDANQENQNNPVLQGNVLEWFDINRCTTAIAFNTFGGSGYGSGFRIYIHSPSKFSKLRLSVPSSGYIPPQIRVAIFRGTLGAVGNLLFESPVIQLVNGINTIDVGDLDLSEGIYNIRIISSSNNTIFNGISENFIYTTGANPPLSYNASPVSVINAATHNERWSTNWSTFSGSGTTTAVGRLWFRLF